MKFYPKALLVTVLAVVVLWFAINVRVGFVAALALAALYEFELLWPTGFFRRSDGRSKTRHPN